MKKIVVILMSWMSICAWSQDANTNYVDKINLNVNVGTSIFYNSASLNIESKTFLNSVKHKLKLSAGFGLWQFSLFDSNDGFYLNTKLVYLLGSKSHHFEVDLGANYQFDIKQNESNYSFLSTAPNVFIGYRYQRPNKRFMFKTGLGMIDFFQFGFGYSF